MDHPNGPVTNGEADEDQGDSLTGKSLAEAQHVAFFIRASVQVLTSFDFNLKMNFETFILLPNSDTHSFISRNQIHWVDFPLLEDLRYLWDMRIRFIIRLGKMCKEEIFLNFELFTSKA
jgi:hypothetical protein